MVMVSSAAALSCPNDHSKGYETNGSSTGLQYAVGIGRRCKIQVRFVVLDKQTVFKQFGDQAGVDQVVVFWTILRIYLSI